MSEMKRPALDYAKLPDVTLAQLSPADKIIAGIAWISDNGSYGTTEAAKRLIDEFRLFARPEELRTSIIEECAKAAEEGLYAADESFLEKRGDEERIPYETGQATIRGIAARIRSLAPSPPLAREGQ